MQGTFRCFIAFRAAFTYSIPMATFIDPDSRTAHLRHGIKTGIAVVLAYVLTLLFSLKYGYWAALSSVIVMQVNVADSVQMCWYRLSGTALGAVIGVLALLLFPHTTAMTLMALFLSVATCAYMTRYDPRYRMAAITVCIVVLASMEMPNPAVFGLFRVIEIAIGVGCAFLVSVLLWPQRAGEALKVHLKQRFNECAELYGELMDCFLSLQQRFDPIKIEEFSERLHEDRLLYRKVKRHERALYHDDTNLLGRKLRTLEKSCIHLVAMAHALNGHHGQGYEILMENELRELARHTKSAMLAIGRGEQPDITTLGHVLDRSEVKLAQLREQGATRRFYLEKLVQFFSFYHGAQYMGRDIWLFTRENF